MSAQIGELLIERLGARTFFGNVLGVLGLMPLALLSQRGQVRIGVLQ